MEETSSALIYRTLKQINDGQKAQRKLDALKSLQIEWDKFKEFSSQQIVGLLLLREDVQNKIQKVLFAEVWTVYLSDYRG